MENRNKILVETGGIENYILFGLMAKTNNENKEYTWPILEQEIIKLQIEKEKQFSQTKLHQHTINLTNWVNIETFCFHYHMDITTITPE